MGEIHSIRKGLENQSTCKALSEVGFEPGSTGVKGGERNH